MREKHHQNIPYANLKIKPKYKWLFGANFLHLGSHEEVLMLPKEHT